LAGSSREFVLSRDGGGVNFFGGCAAPFASLAALGLEFALFAAFRAGGGGVALLGCSAPAGFEAFRAGGAELAGLLAGAVTGLAAGAVTGLAAGALPGLTPGAPAGFAAIVGRSAGLTSVFGRAFGLVAGLYDAAVTGAECPTGIAFGEGASFVTTGWVASDAGGRAEAAAGRAGPLTLSAVGATGFADITLGLDTTSADTLTDAAATGCPP